MDATDVRRAVAAMVEVLEPAAGADWSVPAGPLEWSCRTTAAHVAHDLLGYAGQLTGLPQDGYLPFDLRVSEQAAPGEVLRVVTACGGLLACALAAADPGVRAWHWGPCDPAGFAAMGVAETLLHTHDITTGLGLPWRPDAEPSAGVLARLFPDAPPGEPAEVLLWCTGRGELDGRPRRTSWSWRAAVK
ncbi:maleylpyruvate isomerase N-terminal domain-containing protein [Kitasatospora camelliae]|uniref:Maleylpyruvate isomerase N-terminal domain-containing protein n=1 Tax=Kitasatospora camelliae TaxID=3156397 RepID=A0AAU8JU02_9ACTN